MANEVIWQSNPVCGGVNNTLPDIAIADNELSDSANYQPDQTGQGYLIKREGITKQDTNQRMATTFSVFGGKWNYYHNGTVVYDLAGTSLATGKAAAYDSWCSFQGYDCMVNGTDAIKSANGSSFTTLSNIPSGAKYIAASNNLLYCAGHSHGQLNWSSIGLAETWPATNYRILSQDQGDDICALAPITNGLGVWCTKSFYIISGWGDLDQEVSYSNKAVGCASAPRSVSITPFGPFWWSSAGITWLKGEMEIDYPMRRKLAKTLAGLNRAYDAYVHSVWDSVQGRVMFWLFNGAEQTTQNLRVDFYPQSDAFYLHTGAGVNMSASGVITVSGAENVYCGGYNPTYLYKVSGTTDNGTAIDSYFYTKRMGDAAVQKNIADVILTTDLGTQETVSLGVSINSVSTLNRTIASTVATGLQDTPLGIEYKHYRIRDKVSDSATTRTRILQLTHTAQQEKVRT